uniref:Uncharacterized protein n=1 Tax=Geobacter sp. (strain M21) TaxID=443144 RepID=C6E123_GEOSM
MTTAEILAALMRECPNGVSFESMAVRLLRQKVPFETGQIEDLKAEMFQLGNGLWYSREMISDADSLLAFHGQAMEWLKEYSCFSVEQLFKGFCGVLHHIATAEDCTAFLRRLGFTVAVWRYGGCFCYYPAPSLDDRLTAISEMIAGWLEEADGTLTFHGIEQVMPHLTVEALENIRVRFLPEVHAVEVGGVPCWCHTEAIPLPEDFSEKLTTVVDTLVELEERMSAANIEFALNLLYRIRFRKEYALPDNATFLNVCAKHYLGRNDVFPSTKKLHVRSKDCSVQGRRVRSANTRFHTLGVPVGAKLVFTKDSHINCTVLNDSNQVEYEGKPWAISALAMYLLGGITVNGFAYFTYENEILSDRRLRLEQDGKQEEIPPPPKVPEVESKIIGLEGRPLSPSTWRSFRADGTNPRVAVWVRRIKHGESEEQIARESGYAVSTVKVMISNFRLYLKVCRLNGIVPEGDSDV